MKLYKILIFLLIIINTNITKAQYQSLFGVNQTSWNVKTSQLFGSVLDSMSYLSDTTISGDLFKKCKYYREGSQWSSHVFVREENNLGQAWYFTDDEVTQYLIYDMSLELGNSFHLETVGDIIVDSVYSFEGDKYIRFDYWFGSGLDKVKFTMIEGVGTNVGIVYHDAVAMGNLNPVLLCQEKDGIANYTNNNPVYNGECNLNSSGINENKKIKVSAFPNPTKGSVTVQIENFIKADVYTLSGVIILTTTSKEIDLSQQIKGVYFVKLFTKMGTSLERIILE